MAQSSFRVDAFQLGRSDRLKDGGGAFASCLGAWREYL